MCPPLSDNLRYVTKRKPVSAISFSRASLAATANYPPATAALLRKKLCANVFKHIYPRR
jgi:hypothetical protein